MSDDGHNPDDDHPYFLFSRQLFDTLLLEPKVNLKEQIPRFFDENFVFNVGDNGFIVGHRRLIDLFTSMRDYLDLDASLISPVVTESMLSFTLVYTYTDRRTRDMNVDEVSLKWELAGHGESLRLIEGYVDEEHVWFAKHAKDSAEKADAARAAIAAADDQLQTGADAATGVAAPAAAGGNAKAFCGECGWRNEKFAPFCGECGSSLRL